MVEKTIEPVRVQVDEAALASLGWVAQDVRARLVTETRAGGALMQRVAVAGTVRFEATGRNELFSEIGRAPRVLVTLGRRGSAGPPSYVPVVAEDVEVAVKRAIRFTETSDVWSGSVPSAPEDLEVGVTGYDLDSIRDYEFGLPAGAATALPVTVLDESTLQSLRVRAQVAAEITHDVHGEYLRVHAEGVVELGPVGQLLADRAVRSAGRFGRSSETPSLPVPGFVIEVTDDSDFLLAKRTVRLDGAITVEKTARPPRFVAGFRTSSHAYAGTPTQVVVRILDAEDL